VASLRSVKNSRLCFGCGKENEAGLKLDFELRADGRLETRFVPRAIHGGWEGVFHGGLMATLLDEAMLACLYLKGVDAATAALEVRYREPVEIGEEIRVEAWEEGRKGRLSSMRAEASRAGELVAKASARCLRLEAAEGAGAKGAGTEGAAGAAGGRRGPRASRTA
jgi:acyl-coenzyme A thioesterase PaaI-like protein